jgi:hypothetical protein
MSTLTLQVLGNALGPEALMHPLFTSNTEACRPMLAACLALSSSGQAATAIELASCPVDFVVQDGFLGLRNYMVSELVGERPYIYLKFTNGEGVELSDEIFVGRGSELQFSVSLFLQALALANLSASIHPMHGRVLPLAGLNAVFSFRNYPTGAHTVEDICCVTLLSRAAHALSPEMDSATPTARTLSLQLMQGCRPVGTAVVIGRCL